MYLQYKYPLLPVLLFIAVLSGISTASAQQPDTLIRDLDPIEIEAIYSTISQADAPLSLGLLSRSERELNANASLTMDDITGKLPGIWVNDRENYALGERVSIRGIGWRASFGVRGIQVIMDGIPLTVADGQAMLNSVDPAFVHDIELIRGPASTFWGNSSGGVLYLSTFAPPSTSPFLKIRSTTGSYGLFKQDVQFSQSIGNHDVSAYASYLSQDGYRDYSATRVARAGLKGTLNLNSRSRLEYIGAFVGMPKAQHPSSLDRQQLLEDPTQANSAFVQNEAGKRVYQGQAGLNYYHDTEAGLVTLTGYGIYRDLNNPLPFGIITLDRWAGGLRGTLDKQIGDLHVQGGFDSKLQLDDRKEYENNGGSRGLITVNQLEQVWNRALFVTADYTTGKFTLLGGLRYDWITFRTDTAASSRTASRRFNAISPSIGVSVKTGNQRWYANVTTAFEAPTTTELVNRPGGGNGFNPNLSPEQTRGIDLGGRGSLADGFIRYDAALYRMWIDELLFPYQLSANGPTFYRNQGLSTHSGFEGVVELDLLPRLELNATYNYTRALFESGVSNGNDLEGNEVPGVPLHRIRASAIYSGSSLLAEATYTHVSGYYADNLNTARVQPYGIIDLKLSLDREFPQAGIGIQPYLNVNNLLNEEYTGSIVPNAFGGRYYEPAAGRNVQIGLTVSFQ